MIKKLVFLICMLFPIVTYAEGQTEFSLSDVTVSNENYVTVNLNIENNPDFGMLALRINYDKEKLEYIDSKINGLDSAILKGTDVNKKGQVVLYAITLDENNLMHDSGNILTTQFKIKDNIYGDILLELEVTDYGIDEVNLLDFNSSNGVIHIKKSINTSSKNTLINELKEKVDIGQHDYKLNDSVEDVVSTYDDENYVLKNEDNTVIDAKDGEEKEIYKEEYSIKNVVKKNNILYIFGICFLLIVIIFFGRKL